MAGPENTDAQDNVSSEGISTHEVGGDAVTYAIDASGEQPIAVVQAINGDDCITQKELDAFKANNAELAALLSSDSVQVPTVSNGICEAKSQLIN